MSLPLSYLESILSQIKLDEITQESIEKEMEKDEKEGESRKDEVPPDERVEAVQEANNRGTGSDLSVLRKKDKNTSAASRRRKPGKLPESKSK